jgi:hypothetical protein
MEQLICALLSTAIRFFCDDRERPGRMGVICGAKTREAPDHGSAAREAQGKPTGDFASV